MARICARFSPDARRCNVKGDSLSLFWVKFREFRVKKGISRAEAARRLGVEYSTFCGWRERSQFRRSLLPKLEDVLGWRVSERAAERLGVSLINSAPQETSRQKTISQVLQKIQKHYRGMQKTLRSYSGLSSKLFESLAEGTYFIFTSSTVHPLEFLAAKPHDEQAAAIEATRRSMAQAVLNGCRCLYVRPSKLVTDYYRAWDYGQLTTPQEVRRGFDSFEAFTIREGLRENGDDGPLSDKVRQHVRTHLLQCTIDRCPMWMPGFALAMIGWVAHGEVRTAMTLSLPGRHFGQGVLTYPQYYTLPFRYVRFCRKLCEQAIHAHQSLHHRDGRHKSDAQTYLNVQVEHEHRNSAETLAFFQALDAMLRSANLPDPPLA